MEKRLPRELLKATRSIAQCGLWLFVTFILLAVLSSFGLHSFKSIAALVRTLSGF